MTLKQRYDRVKEELDEYCRQAGRNPDDITLVAVSKTVEIAAIAEAIDGGIRTFGENRPDSLLEKQRAHPDAVWHFIGNIQSRRIADIVSAADMIHSVYKPDHLSRIDAAAKKQGKVQDILLEVNVSGEESKGGIPPEEVRSFLKQAEELPHIRLRGFMTMAPQGDAERARHCFAALRQIKEQVSEEFSGSTLIHDLDELSMGMSEDWREAVSEGATIVRIGRAIFDESFIG